MNEYKLKNSLLKEAQNSLKRAKEYAIDGDTLREINNLILSAAYFREAGNYEKVRETLMEILKIDKLPIKIKSDIMEEIQSL
ncbi:MAG: hypothetical protein GF329_11230 [Candidatus Lokiarchaeota archaeon]|nr:hypothetical protein [Candidatus Lokiarchaeota archaeon]